jgi:hypothetical protein
MAEALDDLTGCTLAVPNIGYPARRSVLGGLEAFVSRPAERPARRGALGLRCRGSVNLLLAPVRACDWGVRR